ncbi:glutaredoxin family protein [Mycolicibacterium mucogenicum]|uniref:glutaredoxin family protein n=1 Tax=Mycolicibacterium mucogenicum TaxID=56689 RepID=UPI00226A1071|nr:glutaredoxin family protein [Mycolicibacterium mucogenicum]MCX8565158.1 glutaredoxin family protein [Mycolicibacterium mucogenicum]
MSAPVAITLLTQSSCGLCEHAKEVLGRLGAEFAVSVTEIDLRTDEGRHLAEGAGVLFAPGVLIEGHPFSYGRLPERKLRKLLQYLAAQQRANGDDTVTTTS